MSDQQKGIESVALENRVFEPPRKGFENAWVKNMDEYKAMYQRSIEDPEGFWDEVAQGFVWHKKWDKVRSYDFTADPIQVRFFEGGKTNLSVNCLDRHVEKGKGDKVAIIWEPGDAKEPERWFTYRELQEQVCKFANVLKAQGAKKGDRVTLYLPMIPELAIAMLACTRIGVIHSIVFGGFSAESLAERIVDAESHMLITCDGVYRGAKAVQQKSNADRAIQIAGDRGVAVDKCIVVRRTGMEVVEEAGRDLWWHDLDGGGLERMRTRADGRRGPAVHPLHVRFNRKAQGGAAHHGRVHDLHGAHLQARL